MNVIIIDSDCKRYYPQVDYIKTLLGDPQCIVYYLDPMQPLQVKDNCRCVLITAMSSALNKYHRDLIIANPQVRRWLISIVNVSFKSEQEQLLDSIDTALAGTKVSYNILFDDCDTLEKTAVICSVPVKEKKMCLIVSKNRILAKQCAEILALYLKQWEIIHKSQNVEQFYSLADVIIAVGDKEEDFVLQASESHMGRFYVWIRRMEQNVSQKLNKRIYEILTKNNWNVGFAREVYSSSLELERYYYKLNRAGMSVLELKNDENFVMWDKYGLPISNKDYSAEVTCSFLSNQCCFENLTKCFE